MIKKDDHSKRVRDSQGWRKNEIDLQNEKRVAEFMGKKWGVVFHEFAKGSPVDFWIEKKGMVAGIAELKTAFKQSDFAFLNMRKYIAIDQISRAFEVAGIYLHQQPSGVIYWSKIEDLRGNPKIVGKQSNFKNDREPVLQIPLQSLKVA